MTILEYSKDSNQALAESQENSAKPSKDLQERSLDDMGNSFEGLEDKFDQLIETVNNIGGEVCKLRADVDGLTDENSLLIDNIKKLKAVIEEKGVVNLDDFTLACEIHEDYDDSSLSNELYKKISH